MAAVQKNQKKQGKNARKRAQRAGVAHSSKGVVSETSVNTSSTKSDDTMIMVGRDLLFTATFQTAGNQFGQILYNQLVADTMFLGTRLGRMFTLFDHYCFEDLEFEAVPAVPTTAANFRYSLTYDADPTDATPSPGFVGLQTLAAQAAFVSVSASEPAKLKPRLPRGKFFTNASGTSGLTSDARLYAQGQFYLAQTGLPASAYTVEVYAKYRCRLWTRNFDNPPAPTTLSNYAAPPVAPAGSNANGNNILRPLDKNWSNGGAQNVVYADGLGIADTVGPAVGTGLPTGNSAIFLPKGNYEIDFDGVAWSANTPVNIVPVVSPAIGSRLAPQVQQGSEIGAIQAATLQAALGNWTTRITVQILDAVGGWLSLTVAAAVTTITYGKLAMNARRIQGPA